MEKCEEVYDKDKIKDDLQDKQQKHGSPSLLIYCLVLFLR